MSENAVVAVEIVPLLRADPHRWGSGAIHLINEEKDQTQCGKSPGGCPGTKFLGTREQITCKMCLRSLEAVTRYEQVRRQMALYRQEQEEIQRYWWDDYNNYLLSLEWHKKRERVLRRSGGYCEGCGNQLAVQVHHRRYPQHCRPGSEEWIAQEKLFDLIAICERCHADVHRGRIE